MVPSSPGFSRATACVFVRASSSRCAAPLAAERPPFSGSLPASIDPSAAPSRCLDGTLSSAQIAYLPQQAHLFAGSLLHNLRLLSGASLERIVQASVATGLAAFVATLPMKFETIVPAGGGNLSGGQRQWILLTAAVASERRLLLMDESLANLDRLTRARLRQGASFDGKSVIWVSHED
jgi:ATP-binding cassette subfamily B protein